MLLFAWLGCAAPSATDAAPAPVDSAPDSVDDSAAVDAPRCPEGMAAVGDPLAPAFCVDVYEAVYEGDVSALDDLDLSALPPEATARSAAAGELPSAALSFDQARAVCANTPVLNEAGEVVGAKRLVSSQEWQDAGDGQLGEGGLRYPYGDTWDDGACVTFDPDDPWDDHQPAGSRAGCVSPFGVYDLIGNLWEWADPGQDLNIGASLAHGEALGLTAREDGALTLSVPLEGQLRLDVAGVDPQRFTQEADGQLIVSEVTPQSWQWEVAPARGFVVIEGVGVEQESHRWLAVVVEPMGEVPGPASVRVSWDEDGEALTDKRGCAYYAGTEGGCALSGAYYGHVHDFSGSIGFRCAADPS